MDIIGREKTQAWLNYITTIGYKRDDKFWVRIGFNKHLLINGIKVTEWSKTGKNATVEVVYHWGVDGTTDTNTHKMVKREYLVELYRELCKESEKSKE